VSAPKKRLNDALRVAAIAALPLLILVAVVGLFGHKQLETMQVGGQTYHLELAKTATQQTIGLGNRKSMAIDHGMLFIMAGDNKQCFWMKNMRFPLDIIWVGSNHKVTHLQPRVEPNTYPQEYCAPAKYVIELNAGQAAKSHIVQDQTLTF